MFQKFTFVKNVKNNIDVGDGIKITLKSVFDYLIFYVFPISFLLHGLPLFFIYLS